MFNVHRLCVLVGALTLASMPTMAQEAQVLRDIDGPDRVTLTKEQLNQLLPGASMGRTTAKGNLHLWKNEPGGSFVVSSDNRTSTTGMPSTAQGKWQISDDGRYCVLMEWKSGSEEWCRFIMKTGQGYYSAKSDKAPTEKVYKLTISK